MRLIPLALLMPLPAHAHPGHLAEVAGHGHWGAAITLGLATGLAIWAGLRGRRTGDDPGRAGTAADGGGEADASEGDEAPA